MILNNYDVTLAIKIDNELEAAKRHGGFNSLHEAYSVILEELDEIWDITKLKKKDRDANEIKKELIQLAAMAIKAYNSVENFVGGKV